LSTRANHLSIFNIGNVLHRLNYSIKVSVERLPHSHVYCFISSFSTAQKWFCKQRLLFSIFNVFIFS